MTPTSTAFRVAIVPDTGPTIPEEITEVPLSVHDEIRIWTHDGHLLFRAGSIGVHRYTPRHNPDHVDTRTNGLAYQLAANIDMWEKAKASVENNPPRLEGDDKVWEMIYDVSCQVYDVIENSDDVETLRKAARFQRELPDYDDDQGRYDLAGLENRITQARERLERKETT